MEASEQPVALQCMPQQPGLIGSEDDWSGLTSTAMRRKVQNRINQRAYRKRKRSQAKQATSPNLRSEPSSLVFETNGSASSEEANYSGGLYTGLVESSSLEHELWRLYSSAAEHADLDRQKLSRVAKICKLGPSEQQRLISLFKKWVQHYQGHGSPRTDHVLVLVKFNVLRALISNGTDLGYNACEDVYQSTALSPFSDPSNLVLPVGLISRALQPTKLQRQIPHHPWIDILPSPVMRDNILLAADSYDVMELCADLVGYFSADRGRMGMIVWGEPWDTAGWEVTESFVKHWGWTIQGCEQLLRSTN